MFAQTDAQIQSVFRWRDHLEGTPRLIDLPLEQQRELVGTFVTENPDWLHDVLAYLPDAECVTVGEMIRGKVDPDAAREFYDSLFNAGLASCLMELDQRIELLYENYCTEFGEYSSPSLSGPSELIGWRPEHE